MRLITTCIAFAAPLLFGLSFCWQEHVDASATESKRSLPFELSDDDIAIGLEWIKIRDATMGGRFGRKSDFFLGFVSGRLKVTPPEWWRRELRRGGVDRVGQTWFSCRNIDRLWCGDEASWLYSGVNNVTSDGESLVVNKNSRSATVQMATLDREDDGRVKWDAAQDGPVAAAMSDDIVALALSCPTDVGGPLALYCIEMKNNKLCWKTDLSRGLKPDISYSGGYNGSFTEILIEQDQISVWVAHDVGVSVEVFDRSSGKRIGGFVSILWNDVSHEELANESRTSSPNKD